jgi:hypothetical protein
MLLRPSARLAPLFLLGAASVFLSGCENSELSRTLGFTRNPPDEFTVTTQAPLSMPPDFNLRPPRPGEPRPQTQSTRLAAEEALAPQLALSDSQSSGAMSPGQQALLAQAGPAAPSNVRTEVDRQALASEPSPGFIDRLMFWRSPQQPGDVVDAQQEAERLRKDSALGQSPLAGPTPIIRSKPKGLLEGIF